MTLSSYISVIMSKLRIFKFSIHSNIAIGKHVTIEKGVVLSCQYGGKISIGDHCILYRNATLITHGGNITIGSYSTVNPYTVIYGQGNTLIGHGVRIAALTTIIPSNHIFKDKNIPIFKQGLTSKGIIIDDDVWIGTGVRILDGVHVRRGCVIGAGSVVTKSTIENGVYVGVPAKLLRKRM